MSSKNQTLQNKRAAKKQKRAKAAARAQNIDRAQHRKLLSDKGVNKTPDVMQSVADVGLIQTVENLRKLKGKAKKRLTGQPSEKITSKQVLESLNSTIPYVMKVSAAVEVLTILNGESNKQFSESHVELINDFDRGAVKMAEDQDAIFTLIENKQEPEEYLNFYVDHLNTVGDFLQNVLPRVVDELLSFNQVEIDAYVVEHAQPEDTFLTIANRLHSLRMERVAPLYRTPIYRQEQAHRAIPAESIQQNDPAHC